MLTCLHLCCTVPRQTEGPGLQCHRQAQIPMHNIIYIIIIPYINKSHVNIEVEQLTVYRHQNGKYNLCLPATLWGPDLGTPGPVRGESGSLRSNMWYHWFCLQRGSSLGPCSHSSGCRCNLHTQKDQLLRHAWKEHTCRSIQWKITQFCTSQWKWWEEGLTWR